MNRQTNKDNIEFAYQSAIKFAKTHYENFPVVSFLIPKELRKHVAIIYWFARTADDLADEGSFTEFERTLKLDRFQERLTELINGNTENDYELALSQTIVDRRLSTDLFFDLLTAFKQDVVKKTYNNFDELLNYCRFSANPVGRLILELNEIRNEDAFICSDKICTALQITNFLQDIPIDLDKDRIYLPQDEITAFAVDHKKFVLKQNNSNLKQLIKLNVERTDRLFAEGSGLLQYLHGRLKFEIKWTILGGREILRRIKKNDYDPFSNRPKLTKADFLLLLLRSLV